MAERILTGDRELDRALAQLDRKTANKVARPALTKAVALAAKRIKAEIPSSLKSVKRSVGYRVRKGANDITVAKAGGGVGKSRAKPVASSSGGVGISRRNVHWWMIGTRERVQESTGRATGKAPKNPVVKRAVSKALGEIKAKLRSAARDALAKLIAKVRT